MEHPPVWSLERPPGPRPPSLLAGMSGLLLAGCTQVPPLPLQSPTPMPERLDVGARLRLEALNARQLLPPLGLELASAVGARALASPPVLVVAWMQASSVTLAFYDSPAVVQALQLEPLPQEASSQEVPLELEPLLQLSGLHSLDGTGVLETAPGLLLLGGTEVTAEGGLLGVLTRLPVETLQAALTSSTHPETVTLSELVPVAEMLEIPLPGHGTLAPGQWWTLAMSGEDAWLVVDATASAPQSLQPPAGLLGKQPVTILQPALEGYRLEDWHDGALPPAPAWRMSWPGEGPEAIAAQSGRRAQDTQEEPSGLRLVSAESGGTLSLWVLDETQQAALLIELKPETLLEPSSSVCDVLRLELIPSSPAVLGASLAATREASQPFLALTGALPNGNGPELQALSWLKWTGDSPSASRSAELHTAKSTLCPAGGALLLETSALAGAEPGGVAGYGRLAFLPVQTGGSTREVVTPEGVTSLSGMFLAARVVPEDEAESATVVLYSSQTLSAAESGRSSTPAGVPDTAVTVPDLVLAGGAEPGTGLEGLVVSTGSAASPLSLWFVGDQGGAWLIPSPERLVDRDGDGFLALPFGLETRDGHLLRAGDCNDMAESIHPEALEDCQSAADEDCDGQAHLGRDQDGDGYARCWDCDDGRRDVTLILVSNRAGEQLRTCLPSLSCSVMGGDDFVEGGPTLCSPGPTRIGVYGWLGWLLALLVGRSRSMVMGRNPSGVS